MNRLTAGLGSSRTARRSLLIASPLLALAVLLAGCGGSGAGGGGTANAAGPTGQAGTGGGRDGAGPPGVSGTIAEAGKGTLQVQDSDSQTAVTYTAKTRFSQVVSAKIAVGDCVTVTGTPVSGSTSAITATSVRVVSSGGGTCSFQTGRDRPLASGSPQSRFQGGGFPGGGRGPGGSAAPSGAAGGGQREFAAAEGKVTSVSGSTVLLTGTLRTGGRLGGTAAPTATPTATPTNGPVTVTLASSASVTKTVSATSAAAKVGKCAAAAGKADTTGTVAATAITISSPGSNGCTRVLGTFGGGGGG
jgi:hypothetical protein